MCAYVVLTNGAPIPCAVFIILVYFSCEIICSISFALCIWHDGWCIYCCRTIKYYKSRILTYTQLKPYIILPVCCNIYSTFSLLYRNVMLFVRIWMNFLWKIDAQQKHHSTLAASKYTYIYIYVIHFTSPIRSDVSL